MSVACFPRIIQKVWLRDRWSVFSPVNPSCKFSTAAAPAAARHRLVTASPRHCPASLPTHPSHVSFHASPPAPPPTHTHAAPPRHQSTALRLHRTHRATAPPPLTALLHLRSRSISWHNLNAAAAPLLASRASARHASRRNSPAADDCRHELCAANNYLRCPAPSPGLASP